MVVESTNVESFFFMHKFIGPKNPLMSASSAYFVFLRRSAKKFRLVGDTNLHTIPPMLAFLPGICFAPSYLYYTILIATNLLLSQKAYWT